MPSASRLTRIAVATVATAALAAPGALAKPSFDSPGASGPTGAPAVAVQPSGSRSPIPDTVMSASAAEAPPTVVDVEASAGFDWGSAAIGGGAGVALALLLAALTAARRGRSLRPSVG